LRELIAVRSQFGPAPDVPIRGEIHLGDAYSRAGSYSEAVDAATRALDLARDHGLRGYEAWALYSLGEVQSRAIPLKTEAAKDAYEAGRSLAHELEKRPLEAMCALGLGMLSALISERHDARAELTAASAALRGMGMQFWLEKAESALSRSRRVTEFVRERLPLSCLECLASENP